MKGDQIDPPPPPRKNYPQKAQPLLGLMKAYKVKFKIYFNIILNISFILITFLNLFWLLNFFEDLYHKNLHIFAFLRIPLSLDFGRAGNPVNKYNIMPYYCYNSYFCFFVPPYK